MDIGKKGYLKKFAPFGVALLPLQAFETFPAFTLRSSSGVAGRGWNKEKEQSKKSACYIIVQLWGLALL
jgi:hypothetical protein